MGLVLGLGMLGLILDSRTAMQGAMEGVELCLSDPADFSRLDPYIVRE